KDYVLATSERVKDAALRPAVAQARPIRYLAASSTDKEALARRLLAEHPVDHGLICALTTVEPCMSFEYHRSPDRHERGLKLRPRKCLHVYQYWLHPRFGFMNARIQTWFPFNIQICLNGREWLARQLARAGRTDFTRVLGRKAHGNFTGELVTSFKDRLEGVRVKHWVNGNSIKMYDKAGSVLRVETTIAKTTDFKVFRPLQHAPRGRLGWRPLRKGVADLHRRAQVSQRSNGNYLEALAAVTDSTPLHQLLDRVAHVVHYHG